MEMLVVWDEHQWWQQSWSGASLAYETRCVCVGGRVQEVGPAAQTEDPECVPDRHQALNYLRCWILVLFCSDCNCALVLPLGVRKYLTCFLILLEPTDETMGILERLFFFL